jgi:hypothetical protein
LNHHKAMPERRVIKNRRKMNCRAPSRALSGITTPKNYAASPAFYFCFR